MGAVGLSIEDVRAYLSVLETLFDLSEELP